MYKQMVDEMKVERNKARTNIKSKTIQFLPTCQNYICCSSGKSRGKQCWEGHSRGESWPGGCGGQTLRQAKKLCKNKKQKSKQLLKTFPKHFLWRHSTVIRINHAGRSNTQNCSGLAMELSLHWTLGSRYILWLNTRTLGRCWKREVDPPNLYQLFLCFFWSTIWENTWDFAIWVIFEVFVIF